MRAKDFLKEFAPNDEGDRPKFIPWKDFIEGVKSIVGNDFGVVGNVVKSTIKAKFVPHDPMEYGPTMLYSYYEARKGRPRGAISNRGSIQVGKYIPNPLTDTGKHKYITSFNMLKGHPFERHFDLTPENIYKVAEIIMGNTKGAYQMQPQGVAEGLNEFLDDRERGDDDGEISKIVLTADRLLKQGYRVDSKVIGAMGRVVRTDMSMTGFAPNGALILHYNKGTGARARHAMRPFLVDDDDRYEFEMVAPRHYRIVDVWPNN